MKDYDVAVWNAKDTATKALLKVSDHRDCSGMATALDDLNKAWGELTDALCLQREVRDQKISELLNELADKK